MGMKSWFVTDAGDLSIIIDCGGMDGSRFVITQTGGVAGKFTIELTAPPPHRSLHELELQREGRTQKHQTEHGLGMVESHPSSP